MRLREVEIHHADLDLDYTFSDWPSEFVDLLLDLARRDPRRGRRSRPRPPTWAGPGRSATGAGPTMTGPGAALAWWATGRDPGDLLSSDSGEVPTQEAW